MPDIYVFCARVLNGVFRDAYGTRVVTHNRYGGNMNSQIKKLLLKPKDLSNTTSCGYILGFSRREGNGVLFLGRPRNKSISDELASSGGALPINLASSKISVRESDELER